VIGSTQQAKEKENSNPMANWPVTIVRMLKCNVQRRYGYTGAIKL
jgi:hypothetical protein